MLIRLRYLLFVMLFVLTGIVGSCSARERGAGVQASFSVGRISDIPAPAESCFAVLCGGVEMPLLFGSDGEAKYLRRNFGCDLFGPKAVGGEERAVSSSCYGAGFSPSPVDYYVFSLERILI